jgi:uncharacterized membrane protein YagU involved in acid resistance
MMQDLLRGGLAGLAATLPMTALMEIWHRRLPAHERRPLPPRQITSELLRKIGLHRHLDEPEKTGLTGLAHLSYGAAVGGVYGLLGEKVVPAGAASGAVYGISVWAVSYLGLMPALRLLSPATKHPARRNALMIAAHLMWGSFTGSLFKGMTSDTQQRRQSP